MRKDFGAYKKFVGNVSHNFGRKLLRIIEESTTDPGGKPDRKKVLLKLADLLAASCSGTESGDWIMIASEIIKDVEDVYQGEPLGEGSMFNMPIAYGSDKGFRYWTRGTKKVGKSKKAQRKQREKKRREGQKGDKDKEKKKKVIYLSDVITLEQGQEIFQEVNSLSDTELAVLLYYRDKHGAVRSMVNGREFGWSDVEHWLVSSKIGCLQLQLCPPYTDFNFLF